MTPANAGFKDPLAGSPWSTPGMVAGFVRSPPNETLAAFARRERPAHRPGRLLDLGCGAGRNLIPLAREGWHGLGTDLSWPMLHAAAERLAEEELADRVALACAPMDRLPVRDSSFDLVVAHGIWNLARSAAELRRTLAEGARRSWAARDLRGRLPS